MRDEYFYFYGKKSSFTARGRKAPRQMEEQVLQHPRNSVP